MRYFVIRPFGTKEGIDFDRVDRDLIQPAIARLAHSGIAMSGGTTGEIMRQGNIREDMFRLIVIADLVIADVSIHNANAFYELGIRHALRPGRTFLIRSDSPHAYPFDLQTDRYFPYHPAALADRVDALAKALHASLASGARDSPVFALLPHLRPHPRAQLIKVPEDFCDAVEIARCNSQYGDLRLLADESRTFEWGQEGLRVVGNAQLKLRAYGGARDTFEALRDAAADDTQANLSLATIYQRLGQADLRGDKENLLAQSDRAICAVLHGAGVAHTDRCEALCLLGSNQKLRLIDELQRAAPEQRRRAFLCSPHLARLLDCYLKSSALDLNAHYPAINALGFLVLQVTLARALPAVWAGLYTDDDSALAELKARQTLADRLKGLLAMALDLDPVLGRRDNADEWCGASKAEYLLLTAGARPQMAAQAYSNALAAADQFAIEASRRNLDTYRLLDQFEPAVSMVLQVFDEAARRAPPRRAQAARAIVFTGHMIDAPDTPAHLRRFPRTPEAEALAREKILAAVAREFADSDGTVIAMGGGACGADILFHEVCRELGIASTMLLALPFRDYQVSSVQRGGPAWVERYRTLHKCLPVRELQRGKALPRWLADKPGYDVWQRANNWMIFEALASGAHDLTVIALFNRELDSQGPGGTAHMLELASQAGFKMVELDARDLLAA